MKLEQAARQACQTPLKDLLRSVPKDGRDCYEESATSHHFIPYGRLIHEALAEIERLEALAEPDIEEMTLTQIAARHEQAEQEPVAWVDLTKEELHQIEMTCETSAECYRVIAKALKDRNYTRPVRTKDLTDKQIEKVWNKNGGYMGMPIDFARAVIAADREKNRG